MGEHWMAKCKWTGRHEAQGIRERDHEKYEQQTIGASTIAIAQHQSKVACPSVVAESDC